MALADMAGRAWTGVIVALALAAGVGAAAWYWERESLRQEGQAIFEGHTPLPAKLAGQEVRLPALATRCVNCHRTEQKNPWIDPSVSTPPSQQTFASPLSPAWLKSPRMRHGGPASVYDDVRLCRLMREGIDPGQVMINSTMPRFEVTDAQCAALWAYLNTL